MPRGGEDVNPRIYAVIIGLILLAAARAGASECSTAGACAAIEHHSASDASKSILVDATGTPYVAGSGVPVAGPVDQAAAGSAAQAWYTRPAPGGANMSPTNPLIVELSDGSTVYAGPTSAQLPAALVGGRLSVDGSGVTQPISAAALPLPAGAATSARQAAPGTAGTPSAEVSSIQGVAGGAGDLLEAPHAGAGDQDRHDEGEGKADGQADADAEIVKSAHN